VPTNFLYFGSSSKCGELSNFALCPIPFEYKGSDGQTRKFHTSEHAYQSERFREGMHRFAVGGDLSTLKSGIPLVFRAHDVQKKLKHYGPKASGRPSMDGIVAKMAVKPAIANERLKMTLKSEACETTETIDVDSIGAMFIEILLSKYRTNPTYKARLLETGDSHLIETGRLVEKRAREGNPPLWTGYVSKVDGVLYGSNFQGEIQMKVRDILRKEAASQLVNGTVKRPFDSVKDSLDISPSAKKARKVEQRSEEQKE